MLTSKEKLALTSSFLADQKSEELPSPNPAGKIEQKAASDVGTELHLDPTAATGSTNSSLKDPDRYCSLCAASFNNPQMALQHYNGRKHQRNVARQELLKELGGDGQQGTKAPSDDKRSDSRTLQGMKMFDHIFWKLVFFRNVLSALRFPFVSRRNTCTDQC